MIILGRRDEAAHEGPLQSRISTLRRDRARGVKERRLQMAMESANSGTLRQTTIRGVAICFHGPTASRSRTLPVFRPDKVIDVLHKPARPRALVVTILRCWLRTNKWLVVAVLKRC